jgi:hypothetical protein
MITADSLLRYQLNQRLRLNSRKPILSAGNVSGNVRPLIGAAGKPEPMLNPGRPFDLRAYVEKLSPDLGYVILTATIVEEQLELLLLTQMHLDEIGVAEWFGDYKPYNSFAGKIRGAHSRALIDDETRSDLLFIKDVRNAFAHTRERLDFKGPSIRALAEKLSSRPEEFDVRQLFDERVERVITAMQAKSGQIIFDQASA